MTASRAHAEHTATANTTDTRANWPRALAQLNECCVTAGALRGELLCKACRALGVDRRPVAHSLGSDPVHTTLVCMAFKRRNLDFVWPDESHEGPVAPPEIATSAPPGVRIMHRAWHGLDLVQQ